MEKDILEGVADPGMGERREPGRGWVSNVSTRDFRKKRDKSGSHGRFCN